MLRTIFWDSLTAEMLLIRAALLEVLVCFLVLGGAVLFRRLFRRESPWLAFLLPVIAAMFAFNFIEHFVALPQLEWLLPFLLLGLGWVLVRHGLDFDGLFFPGAIFVGVFTWVHFIRCLNPTITCNTEGVADMARVLDFCLGNKLPPVDTWCPPYDHGGYYSFQHYGASLLTRLLGLDIGTGYNMGYTLANTLTIFAGVGAAHVLSGGRVWVSLTTLLVLLANFNGSSVLLFFWDLAHPAPNVFYIFDSRLALDIGDAWNVPARHNPFGWIFHQTPPVLRLFTTAYEIYFPEFHATIGGHFMTLASLLAAHEAFRPQRTNGPWICLLIFPVMTLITATWFFIIVAVLCAGGFAAALIAGRRPANGALVGAGAGVAFLLIWPSVNSIIGGSYPIDIHWTPWNEFTNPWEFLIQWWPAIVPWLGLFFVYGRLNLTARFVHAALPLLLIFVELVTFSDRGLTVEKMWGGIYSAALVTFLPLVFLERALMFRIVRGVFVFLGAVLFLAFAKMSLHNAYPPDEFCLRGDNVFQHDPQKKRIEQVLARFRGVTVLNGKSEEAYNQSPSLVGFTENMCYIAWFFQEYQCGHGGEAEFRDQQSNAFYAGTLPDELGFLRSNRISAVVIFPDDAIGDDMLAKLKTQLALNYYYIDCKGDGPNNAGVFVAMAGGTARE